MEGNPTIGGDRLSGALETWSGVAGPSAAEAGLSPLEAIRAATSESARIAGHGDELGRVAVGMLADLVVLEPGAEPWRDIRETRRIREVIIAGRLVDRAALLRP